MINQLRHRATVSVTDRQTDRRLEREGGRFVRPCCCLAAVDDPEVDAEERFLSPLMLLLLLFLIVVRRRGVAVAVLRRVVR